MASEIICRHCGFPNSAGSINCEICDEPLAPPAPQPQVVQTAPQAAPAAPQNPGREYFVVCPESNHRTVVADENQTSYFCAGCGKVHEIDGFIWVVESTALAPQPQAVSAPQPTPQPRLNRLTLEEMNTRQRIEIAPQGGTLGRYGDFGADFFQRNNLLYVSGVHCAFQQQYGNWCIQHMSRTNQTKYDGQILDHDQFYLLENGKVLTLANCVSFIVHID